MMIGIVGIGMVIIIVNAIRANIPMTINEFRIGYMCKGKTFKSICLIFDSDKILGLA